MGGIFGTISSKVVSEKDLRILAMHSRQRGREYSGLVYNNERGYVIKRFDYGIINALNKEKWSGFNVVIGNSSSSSKSILDSQPVVRDGIILIHDGIVVNEQDVWEKINIIRKSNNASEIIIGIVLKHFEDGGDIIDLPQKILTLCEGD